MTGARWQRAGQRPVRNRYTSSTYAHKVALVTRYSRDFREVKVEARTPGEALALIVSTPR